MQTKSNDHANSFSSNQRTDLPFSILAIRIWTAAVEFRGNRPSGRNKFRNSAYTPAFPAGETPWNKGWFMFPFTVAIKKKLESASKHGAKGELPARLPRNKTPPHEDAGEPVLAGVWPQVHRLQGDVGISINALCSRPTSIRSKRAVIYLKYFCLSARVMRSFPLGQRVERIRDYVAHYTRWKTHFLRDYTTEGQERL